MNTRRQLLKLLAAVIPGVFLFKKKICGCEEPNPPTGYTVEVDIGCSCSFTLHIEDKEKWELLDPPNGNIGWAELARISK